jgi:nicotinamidase-related amidase
MNDHPKSLLQFAQAPTNPSPLDQSALVIIDAQLEYTVGTLPLKGIDAAIGETKTLLTLARHRKMPVFYVVHHSRAGAALFDPTGPNVAIVSQLAPVAGEEVVIKTLPNAFTGTALHQLLQKTGRKELILAGFMTHNCVSSTARGALDLGYRTTIVASATATRDLPNPIGGTTPAEIVQEGTLSALADRVAIIVPKTAALLATALNRGD